MDLGAPAGFVGAVVPTAGVLPEIAAMAVAPGTAEGMVGSAVPVPSIATPTAAVGVPEFGGSYATIPQYAASSQQFAATLPQIAIPQTVPQFLANTTAPVGMVFADPNLQVVSNDIGPLMAMLGQTTPAYIGAATLPQANLPTTPVVNRSFAATSDAPSPAETTLPLAQVDGGEADGGQAVDDAAAGDVPASGTGDTPVEPGFFRFQRKWFYRNSHGNMAGVLKGRMPASRRVIETPPGFKPSMANAHDLSQLADAKPAKKPAAGSPTGGGVVAPLRRESTGTSSSVTTPATGSSSNTGPTPAARAAHKRYLAAKAKLDQLNRDIASVNARLDRLKPSGAQYNPTSRHYHEYQALQRKAADLATAARGEAQLVAQLKAADPLA